MDQHEAWDIVDAHSISVESMEAKEVGLHSGSNGELQRFLGCCPGAISCHHLLYRPHPSLLLHRLTINVQVGTVSPRGET